MEKLLDAGTRRLPLHGNVFVTDRKGVLLTENPMGRTVLDSDRQTFVT